MVEEMKPILLILILVLINGCCTCLKQDFELELDDWREWAAKKCPDGYSWDSNRDRYDISCIESRLVNNEN